MNQADPAERLFQPEKTEKAEKAPRHGQEARQPGGEGGERGDRNDPRRRRPRKRGVHPGQNGQPGQLQQAREGSSQEDALQSQNRAADKGRQEGAPPAQAGFPGQQGRSGRGQRSRQTRNYQEGRESSREIRENRAPRDGRRPEGRGQEAPRREGTVSRYLPDWGTPPEPSQSMFRKKPVDQPLSGRSFTRRG